MPEEWFEIAAINFHKLILHGRVRLDGRDKFGCAEERYIEQVLTEAQKVALDAMSSRHSAEEQRLLSSFVDRDLLAQSGASKNV